MYNIVNATNDRFMLGSDVFTLQQAQEYVIYYRRTYGRGVPYYNHKGIHDGDFFIVKFDTEDKVYRCIH